MYQPSEVTVTARIRKDNRLRYRTSLATRMQGLQVSPKALKYNSVRNKIRYKIARLPQMASTHNAGRNKHKVSSKSREM